MTDTRPFQAAQSELARYLSSLPPERQRELLDFARFLAMQEAGGAPVSAALEALSGILPAEDAREMSDIIEAGCERVDAEGW